MRKILHFALICAAFIGIANAAVRDENATERQSVASVARTSVRNTAINTVPASARTATSRNGATSFVSRTNNSTTNTTTAGARPSSARNATNATARATTTPQSASSVRSAVNTTISRNSGTYISSGRGTSGRTATTPRTATNNATVSRAATDTDTSTAMSQTRTGAEYEQCKSAYFNCMDQFCQLKNDDYRRCSCSNRVYELAEIRGVMQDASDQLTVFTENLDVVGMTAEQATAMKTATEGENALTSDTSASKQLLQAIMNSIRGEDASVGGKYSDLNSITLSFDTANAFGTMDTGQVIAAYNGENLYTAVYPQCRAAVRADCTDAQLQRAITAYLMAIEQDCNSVASAIENKQKQMKSAVRESSAMLDLARVENRQKHNSDDLATCIANVESAILSEEVCGAGYHKCLDNGEFIDVSTGAPIAGVENFYELGELLKFSENVDAADQKLAKNVANRAFVQSFENRVKKFAEPALDKCTEIADNAWSEYLDKAMLDIYYAQQAKVKEIKQGCFDFVSACYVNSESAITAAMQAVSGSNAVLLQPHQVKLSHEMCNDYINSCNMMFYDETGGQNIITDYVNNRQDTDLLDACRAVVKQCFDNFGGTGYENFYYPYSGLFKEGEALDWFTLYEYSAENQPGTLVSPCAKQLTNIESCNDPLLIRRAFGGFDRIKASADGTDFKICYGSNCTYDGKINYESTTTGNKQKKKYGTLKRDESIFTSAQTPTGPTAGTKLEHHVPRPTGVATEVYNQIVDILSTQCTNIQGRFIEYQYIKTDSYKLDTPNDPTANACISQFNNSSDYSATAGAADLRNFYGIVAGENMCPRDYPLNVDTESWGACLCWENGGRRSKNGTSPKCVSMLPVNNTSKNDANCTSDDTIYSYSSDTHPATSQWCSRGVSSQNQVCPLNASVDPSTKRCKTKDGTILDMLPTGLGADAS